MVNVIKIRNIREFDDYLRTQNTEQCNIANYVWIEYGFYPILFNELYHEFFTTLSGKYIGVCFQGQEILYEDKVEDLLVLENFIDTKKAYQNNKETELLLQNFQTIQDRGIAFWYTIRNFDEDEYARILEKYRFKNILHPIGKDTPWKLNLFSLSPYKYSSGERDMWTPENAWYRTGTLGWDLRLWKTYTFPNISKFNPKEYYALFVKNTWKSRNYSSSNISDFLVGDGKQGIPGYGFFDYNLFVQLVDYLIGNNEKIVIITDLVKYPVKVDDNIEIFDMIGFFDIKQFCSIVHNSKAFITSSTSPLDLASYYCDTDILCLDDRQNKREWVNTVLSTKGKKAYSITNQIGSFNCVSNSQNKFNTI